MIEYTRAITNEDLLGILALQKANLSDALTKEEIESQGFVTVNHSYEELKNLNDIEKHLIAKEEDKVIAYLLAMTERSKYDLPVLIPMFDMFESILYADKLIASCNYIVVGQVCVDKRYRGQGILDQCYAVYKDHFSNKYDFAITEIASTNLRSLNAHIRIGFKEIHRYPANDQMEWSIVLWDWENER